MNLSENYYLRKCYMQQEQVPTQSMIRKKMSPPLAAVYFKSMNKKLKELAGLEPSLAGGGSDWYVPPEDMLKGRAVLKPVDKTVLTKLSHRGIESLGVALFERHHKAMHAQKENDLYESDLQSRQLVIDIGKMEWSNQATIAKNKNTNHLINEVNRFTQVYRQSLGKIESLLQESIIVEINNTRKVALQKMQQKYVTDLKCQAKTVYDDYDKKLKEEKARLKAEFVHQLDISNKTLSDILHDIKVDKHAAVENLRQFIKCKNLACSIYVALKEREESLKTLEEMKRVHTKKIKKMREEMVIKELEIDLAKYKEKKRQEFCKNWKRKVCLFVRNFQKFVSYSLNELPEHAEFFINMEKLMLLQINDAIEDPSNESIFEEQEIEFHTPIPQSVPFYLFCDTGYKATVDQALCPKRVSSRTSLFPAIIINRQCLYAACDNINEFNNKIKDYIHGSRGDDADLNDDLIYEHFVPVNYTSMQQLSDMKLESSLLQILHQEIANRADPSTLRDACRYCKGPWCACSVVVIKEPQKSQLASPSTSSKSLDHDIPINIKMEQDHEREPTLEGYCAHMKSRKCRCAKMARKHLAENLPVYMRQMKYGPPEIPNYEICPISTLKELVEEARKRRPAIPSRKTPMKTYADKSAQCLDQDFETLCTCFSESEIDYLFSSDNVAAKIFDSSWPNMAEDGDRKSYISQGPSSFATARALSLRNLVEGFPDLQDIFKGKKCDFE